MKVVYGKGVFEELVEIAWYIAQDDQDAGIRFLHSCEVTFALLSNNPRIGVLKQFTDPLLQDVRMWRVADFERYLIFYRATSDEVRILHVVHGARDYDLLFGGDE